jgi:hypothetical protein
MFIASPVIFSDPFAQRCDQKHRMADPHRNPERLLKSLGLALILYFILVFVFTSFSGAFQ